MLFIRIILSLMIIFNIIKYYNIRLLYRYMTPIYVRYLQFVFGVVEGFMYGVLLVTLIFGTITYSYS